MWTCNRRSTSTIDENNDEVKKIILANRRFTIRKIAEDLNISIGSCHLKILTGSKIGFNCKINLFYTCFVNIDFILINDKFIFIHLFVQCSRHLVKNNWTFLPTFSNQANILVRKKQAVCKLKSFISFYVMDLVQILMVRVFNN